MIRRRPTHALQLVGVKDRLLLSRLARYLCISRLPRIEILDYGHPFFDRGSTSKSRDRYVLLIISKFILSRSTAGF